MCGPKKLQCKTRPRNPRKIRARPIQHSHQVKTRRLKHPRVIKTRTLSSSGSWWARARSEERRVGKEWRWRSGWEEGAEKKERSKGKIGRVDHDEIEDSGVE